jgi:hypothetical protein
MPTQRTCSLSVRVEFLLCKQTNAGVLADKDILKTWTTQFYFKANMYNKLKQAPNIT